MKDFILFPKGQDNHFENNINATKINGSGAFQLNHNVFGFLLEGEARLINDDLTDREILAGDWFVTSQHHTIVYSDALMMLVDFEQENNTPFAMGQIEPKGRLKYIDGAFNSLIFAPPRKGDACLNVLYLNEDINQTAHTHPSERIGFVANGTVISRIWDSEDEGATLIKECKLEKGDMWFMSPDVIHTFHSKKGDDLVLVTFHPDSDFGATDEEAPMINRTIIYGVSAKGDNEPAKNIDKYKK